MKKFWKWTNQAQTETAPAERTLYLNGTIAEESWFDDDVTPQLFKEELMAGDGNITVWINSPGGDCVAAAQIYNMLMDYPHEVTVKIDGIAASAASVIAMAGTRVLMSPVSVLMIHNPMTVAMGDTGEMHMATIGLDKLYYAKITEDASGNETYGDPQPLAKAMTAELSVELAEATLYADDGAAAVVKEFQSGTLTLGVDGIGVTVAQDLTGATIDGNKVLVSTSEDGGTPVAVGFRAKKANGKYRYFWLYRVKFGIPATNLTTKGESIEFSTPSIEGTVTRRNKVDGQGRHPWKAEVSEDDTGVLPATISGWYEEVYEPDYSTLETA